MFSIQNRRFPSTAIKHDFQVFGSPQFLHGEANESNLIPGFFKPLSHDLLLILDQADHGNSGGGVNRFSFGFIIEADITTDYWNIKKPAGIAHAFYSLLKLPHNFRFFWIAKIKAIGQAYGFSTRTYHVAAGFGNRDGGTLIGVEIAVAAVAIYRHGNSFIGILNAHDGRI